jgi:phosphomannomutase
VGEEINEEIAYDIGLAFVNRFHTRSVVVGRDIRESSEMLMTALSNGLTDAGASVYDIGICGTEVVYFANPHLGCDGGIMVTASHNPRDYNGMKFVGRDSTPISGDNGLYDIRDMILSGSLERSGSGGNFRTVDIWDAYVDRVISFISDPERISGCRIVTDPGHGCAGPALDLIAERLCLDPDRMHHEPDGSFPAGIPNPLLPEMRESVSRRVREVEPEMGVAWDGDYDRCFLFDEYGSFIDGYYIVGLIASKMLEGAPGEKIIHDPRLTWNTIELVEGSGGIPVMNRTGHAFIKERMRKEDAIYGGEMSAHHYFRDFHYCDTGMVPWLIVLEMIAERGRSLSALIGERMRRYPVSGEINRKVEDQNGVIRKIENLYSSGAVSVDHTDGVSIEHEKFRFNLRASNTEPLIRLNVETRGDRVLLDNVTGEILSVIDSP